MHPARREWAAAAAVALVALAIGMAGLRNQLVQDDAVLITRNTALHDLRSWPSLFTSPFWPAPWNRDLYRPLTSLLLAVEWSLGGGGPLLFRLVSAGLYAAGAVALYRLARRVLPAGAALAAAALWAAHPVHVEAVALGVGQAELLVGLLAVLTTGWYLDAGARAGRWAALVSAYLAACLFKEHALILPALWLAAEWLLVEGPLPPRLRRAVPGYVALGVAGAAIVAVRAAVLGGRLGGSFTAEALEGVGPGGRALTLLRVVPEWARLLLWPAHLQSDYSPREIVASARFGGLELLGLLLLVAAVAATLWLRRRSPVAAFGLAWTAIALFPVSNLLVPTGIVLAERTLFLPSVGVALLAGALLAPLLRRAPHAAAVTVGALVVLGAARSIMRQKDWRDEEVFTRRSVADAPLSYRMQQAWGYQLFRTGEREAGLAAYRRAMEYAPAPHLWRVRNDLARRFWEVGENEPAVAQLRASKAEAPEQEETRRYLVLGLLALGRYPEAAGEADSALVLGFSREEFGGLRALADSAIRDRAPPGSIRIRINTGPPPGR